MYCTKNLELKFLDTASTSSSYSNLYYLEQSSGGGSGKYHENFGRETCGFHLLAFNASLYRFKKLLLALKLQIYLNKATKCMLSIKIVLCLEVFILVMN